MISILNFIKQNIFYLNEHPFIRYVLVASILVALMSIFLVRWVKSKKTSRVEKKVFETDMEAIAGDDRIATELDLAKAYIEMNDITLAKKMLNNAIKKGNSAQQQEARQLINAL